MRAGWTTKTLGEVLLKTATVDPTRSPDEEFEYIDVSSVSNETYVVEATQRLKGRDAPSRARRHVRSGDVLLATIRPTLKRIAVIPPELDGQICSTGYFVLRPCGEVDHRFLFYSLFTDQFMGAMASLQKGASYPAVTDPEVRAQLLSFPSLPEQRRIVAILDEAFEGIAKAKANAEKNLRNAQALVDRVRQKSFDELVLVHGVAKLGACCAFENGDRGKSYPGKEHRVASGIPFVNAGHMSEGGLNFAKMDYISAERFEMLGNGKIRPHDVLFCLRGSLGKYAYVGDLKCGAIASSLVILRPRPGLITKYLLEFFASSLCADQIDSRKGGAAQPNLGANDLKLFELPVPSMEEQSRVADGLSDLGKAVGDLGALLRTKLVTFNELKQSLLHQAFTGALTTKSTDKQLSALV